MNEFGLSTRGGANVKAVWPRIKQAAMEREKAATAPPQNTPMDMSTSESWLIRDEVIEIYKRAVQSGLDYTHLSYPNGFAGDVQLLDAVVTLFNNFFDPHLPVVAEHVAMSTGAAFVLDALLYNICEPGEGLLLPAPFWNGFDWLLGVRAGVQPVPVPVENFDEVLTTKLIGALEETYSSAVRPIKGLLFTNPHNPFGQCYPVEVIQEVIGFCQRKNIHFISDEIYALSYFDNNEIQTSTPFTSVLSIDVQGMGCDLSRVHTIWSISKDLGSSGLRMGCCVTQNNGPLRTGLALSTSTQMSSLTAIATASLLTSPELPRLLSLHSERLGRAYQQLTVVLRKYSIPYIAANMGPFVFARIAPGAQTWDDEAAAVACLKEAGVTVSSGRSYHGPDGEKGWARINFALQPAVLVTALKRLESVLQRAQEKAS